MRGPPRITAPASRRSPLGNLPLVTNVQKAPGLWVDPTLMGLVSGKVSVVTGSAAGIGRAAALKFAEEGAKVVVSDVNTVGGNETVAFIKRSGGDAIFVGADISKASDLEGLIEKAIDVYGRLDCACNNAGIAGKILPFIEQSEAILIGLCP